jgi:hypothetical protein
MDRARAGLLHLLYDGARVEILVPPLVELVEHFLGTLPPVGTPVELWDEVVDGCAVTRLLWFADPDEPRWVRVGLGQWTSPPPPADYGRVVPLIWYTAIGDEGAIERRREEVQIGPGRAS